MHSISSLCRFVGLLCLSSLLTGCPPSTKKRATVESTSAPITTAPHFKEVAQEAGLDFTWTVGDSKRKSPLNIAETAGGGAAFLDYDNDGNLDILLVGSRTALFHQEAGGKFREVTAGSGLNATGMLMGCTVGDVDNDGFSDILITGQGSLHLYHNLRGTGKFEERTAKAFPNPPSKEAWATSAGFTDLDHDGNLDLVVCHYVTFTPETVQLCEYSSPTGEKIKGACPPLYYKPQTIQVFRNKGGGIFEEKTTLLPKGHGANLGLGFADVDGDGKMDFYIANDGQPGDLYHNLGSWRFENLSTQSGTGYNQEGREQAGMGVDWGDYDHDGKLDLLVTTFQNEPRSLYHNEGGGTFAYTSFITRMGDATRSHLAFGCAFLDADNDGWLDLLFANGHVQDTIGQIRPPATYAQNLQFFVYRGEGGFYQEATQNAGEAFQKPIVGRALAVGDYDNDGYPDVLVSDLSGKPLLLHNETPKNQHWIGFQLKSKYQRREAIGTRVILTTSEGERVGEVQTCRSYLSASDPRIRFGLGAQNRPLKIKVKWVGGKETELHDLPVDRYILIEEK